MHDAIIKHRENREMETSSMETEATNMAFLPYTIAQTPFLYPPTGRFVPKQILETITFPNMDFQIPVWYLVPPTILGSLGITSIGITPITPQEATMVYGTPIAALANVTKKTKKREEN